MLAKDSVLLCVVDIINKEIVELSEPYYFVLQREHRHLFTSFTASVNYGNSKYCLL